MIYFFNKIITKNHNFTQGNIGFRSVEIKPSKIAPNYRFFQDWIKIVFRTLTQSHSREILIIRR
tara:strand:- start:991 stop:1182 length:192 start_codon:yes stop_codon:yes gene_type:complete